MKSSGASWRRCPGVKLHLGIICVDSCIARRRDIPASERLDFFGRRLVGQSHQAYCLSTRGTVSIDSAGGSSSAVVTFRSLHAARAVTSTRDSNEPAACVVGLDGAIEPACAHRSRCPANVARRSCRSLPSAATSRKFSVSASCRHECATVVSSAISVMGLASSTRWLRPCSMRPRSCCSAALNSVSPGQEHHDQFGEVASASQYALLPSLSMWSRTWRACACSLIVRASSSGRLLRVEERLERRLRIDDDLLAAGQLHDADRAGGGRCRRRAAAVRRSRSGAASPRSRRRAAAASRPSGRGPRACAARVSVSARRAERADFLRQPGVGVESLALGVSRA